MKKFLTRILIVAMYLLLIVGLFDINKIRAASYGFNFVGPTSANNGDTITLTITANGLTGKVKLSATNATLSDSKKWVEKNSVSITAKITGFPANITATPEDLTDNDYNIVSISPKTVTVNEIKKEEPKPSTSTQQNQVQSSQGTTNQGQSSQTTTPPPTTNYSDKTSNQSTSSSKPSQTTTSSTTGKQTANEENKPNIDVTNNENATSSNNYLKSLKVNVGTITPEFDREILEYTINDVDENDIEIIGEAEDERAIISGTGTIALTEGENIINITVTAESLAVRTYKLIINKKQKITQSDLRLNTLEIKKINESGEFYDLDIGFDKEKFDYSVEVEDDITDLDVIPTVEKEGIIVQTEGQTNLEEGENNINITLTNQNEPTQKTVYSLKIIKAEKPIVETYSTPKKEKNILPICIIISLVVIIGVIVYIMTKKKIRKY